MKPSEASAKKAKQHEKIEALKKKAAAALKLTPEEQLAVEMCIQHWTPEDLRPEFRDPYLRVREKGMGVCSSCRWTSGCLRCDPEKAWSYYVRQELGLAGSKAKKAKKG